MMLRTVVRLKLEELWGCHIYLFGLRAAGDVVPIRSSTSVRTDSSSVFKAQVRRDIAFVRFAKVKSVEI